MTRSRLLAGAAASSLAVLALVALGLPAAHAADSSALLTWTRAPASVTPPARLHAAMADDPATNTTVLFGGRSGSQVMGDTWTWDGSGWAPQVPIASPPPLESASMAYDNIGHQVILFGGINGAGIANNATWSWNGSTWAPLAPATVPPARYAASIAADSLSGTDVLFGGVSASGLPLGDTWSWDGTNWNAGPAAGTPAAAPAARSGGAMTFDATRGVVVLFGGTTRPTGSAATGSTPAISASLGFASTAPAPSGDLADTWTWDGLNWSQKAPAKSPPARTDAAFGFDTGTQTAVLFGGTNGGGSNGAGSNGVGTNGTVALGDTWLWNGSNWSTSLPLTLLPVLSPPARAGASMAADPVSSRPVLFGGESGGLSPSPLGDTWRVSTLVSALPPGHPATTVTTTAGSSTTGDGVGGSTSTTTGATGANATSSLPTSTPTTHPAPLPAPLGLASRSVRRGDLVRVSGGGFVPGAKITITIHSVSTVVGTTFADLHGQFSTTVLVPADVATGSHHIEAAGAAMAGGQAVLVAQLSITAPGATNGWLLPAFMVALTVLLAAGAGVVLTASTRKRPQPAR